MIWGGTLRDREAAGRARVEGKLVMQLDENIYSVELRGEDETYFMNHSCDSNVWMTDAVTLVARKTIPIGEELTVDYALFEVVEDFTAEWECVCGSTVCRKQVTGRDGDCWSFKSDTLAISCHSSANVWPIRMGSGIKQNPGRNWSRTIVRLGPIGKGGRNGQTWTPSRTSALARPEQLLVVAFKVGREQGDERARFG